MNIWLINPYDELPGEGPEQRYGCLARTLSEQGHQVVWVSSAFRHRDKEVRGQEKGVSPYHYTFSPKHAESENAVMHGLTPFSEESAGGAASCGGPFILTLIQAPAYRKNISLRRLWSQWKWARNVEREMVKRVQKGEVEKPDLILASSPPLEGARAGIRLARRFDAKAVVDMMDDWPETWRSALSVGGMGQGGGSMEHGAWGLGNGAGKRKSNVEHRRLKIELRNRVLGALGRVVLWPWFRMARWNMRHADAVTAQSVAFAQRAKELGFQKDVPVCYLGGARSALSHPGEASLSPPKAEASFRTPNELHILYLGAMGRIYDIDTLLRTAALAKEKGLPWRWTLAGEDPDGQWASRTDDLDLSDVVSFPGYLTGEEKEAILQQADLGLIPMNPESGVAVPYKAGDYLAAGLPVINSLPGELTDLLRDFGAGVDYEYGNASSLFDRIQGFADDSETLHNASSGAGKLFEAHFNREKTYPRFARELVSEFPVHGASHEQRLR